VFGGIGSPLGRAQIFEAIGRLLEHGIEVADGEPRQGRLHAVDNAALFANEALTLPVRPLGIFVHKGWDGDLFIGGLHRWVYTSANRCHRSIKTLPTDAITSPHPP
jgi:hypothetical protein